MKKLFTFAVALLATMAMSAETIYGPFTLTAENNVANQANEVNGGTATVTTVFPTGSSNEVAIDDWTFYKFNSSSAVKCALADDATFAVGDSIYVTLASHASSNKTCGVKLNNSITVSGTIPGGQTATFGYEVVENDGIAGANFFTIYRSSSDSKFGRVWVTRENATPSTDPVESAEISGADACALGGSIELTCNAPKATTYQWSMNGAEIEGANAKKYTFTPSAAGEFSFTCAASNEYNVTPVVASAHVITVSDPAAACGELIKAVLAGGTSATMSGVLGGTFDTNLGSGKYKLDKGKYIGIQLAAGSFIAGDVVTITMTTAGQNYPCLFADKDRTNCLFLATEVSEALEYQITLPSAATGLTSLYLSRDDDDATYKWNPVVASISVTRSCEASDNADLEKVWIQVGEMYQEYEAAEDGLTYNLAVPASVDLAELDVYFKFAHPMANANVTSPVHFTVPEAGQSVSETVVVTAQDGETVKTYTINVSKSAAASTEAHLSSLSVAGYTLVPEFSEDVLEYTITKAYGAENPGTAAITADPKDPTAHPHAEALENALQITVTAEDNETQVVYTINIVEADAKKDLLEALFSNGAKGYIASGNINVPYLEGEEEPTFVSAQFWNADGEPTAEIVEGNLVVTGADNKTASYTIAYIPVTPMEANYEEITFDGVPSYIYSVYGWDADKGVKFSKDVEEASNHRVSEGKSRIYIALPAAKEVSFVCGTGNKRPVRIMLNGEIYNEKFTTPDQNESFTITLDPNKANFIGIESNGNNGDAGFVKMQLTEAETTALEGIEAGVKAVKVVRNGQLYILKGDVLYNALGTIVK